MKVAKAWANKCTDVTTDYDHDGPRLMCLMSCFPSLLHLPQPLNTDQRLPCSKWTKHFGYGICRKYLCKVSWLEKMFKCYVKTYRLFWLWHIENKDWVKHYCSRMLRKWHKSLWLALLHAQISCCELENVQQHAVAISWIYRCWRAMVFKDWMALKEFNLPLWMFVICNSQ